MGIGGSLPAAMGRGDGGSETAIAAGEEERCVAFCNRETAIMLAPRQKRPMMSGHTKAFFTRLHIGESMRRMLRICSCAHEPWSAIRPRHDIGGFGIHESNQHPGVARSDHYVLRFRADPGPDETAEGHELATAKFVGRDFGDDQSIVSEAIRSGSALGGSTVECLQQRRVLHRRHQPISTARLHG